ncbi:MAG: ribonuclease Z [Nitrososphaera sp.]|jgi:ribonuclease Z
MVNLTITFLGTSSAVPTPERGLSSIAITRGSELLLFDTGEGMQRNFIKAGLGMNRKMKVFISHMHSDHCIGLLGLMQTMSLQGRTNPLDVYGQPALREFIVENMRIIRFGLGFDVNVHTIEKEGVIATEPDYRISCQSASHSIPALSFCLEEFERPGVFRVERAKELALPEGELYSRLQRGEDVEYQGRKVRSADMLGPPRRGRKICISGDTRPTDELAAFFDAADVLVHESTYSTEKQDKAIEYFHSTAREAAAIAKRANVKKLFLTHFSARYDETELLLKEALSVHPDVTAADDLMEVTVPYSE